MLKTMQGIIRGGRIELQERAQLPEGAVVLVTVLPDEEGAFWLQPSQRSVDAVWDNGEDDIYGRLLEK